MRRRNILSLLFCFSIIVALSACSGSSGTTDISSTDSPLKSAGALDNNPTDPVSTGNTNTSTPTDPLDSVFTAHANFIDANNFTSVKENILKTWNNYFGDSKTIPSPGDLVAFNKFMLFAREVDPTLQKEISDFQSINSKLHEEMNLFAPYLSDSKFIFNYITDVDHVLTASVLAPMMQTQLIPIQARLLEVYKIYGIQVKLVNWIDAETGKLTDKMNIILDINNHAGSLKLKPVPSDFSQNGIKFITPWQNIILGSVFYYQNEQKQDAYFGFMNYGRKIKDDLYHEAQWEGGFGAFNLDSMNFWDKNLLILTDVPMNPIYQNHNLYIDETKTQPDYHNYKTSVFP